MGDGEFTNSEIGVSKVMEMGPLFSIGDSSFFMNGACGGGACNFNFSIRDSFKNPIGKGTFELPFDIPGGQRFSINHTFHVNTINEGTTRVRFR